ncbi:MAG: enoyl-CoA hydratase/isomerase family protein, partial [Gemmatimonadota bacterium]
MARAVVRLERVDAVARITLDAPPLNVLDRAALVELSERLAEAGADPGAKVVLLTGTGRAFCAGVDVADHTADRVEGMIEAFSGAIETLLGLELPVVAALNGAALGGGLELALASDIVLAGEGAKLG